MIAATVVLIFLLAVSVGLWKMFNGAGMALPTLTTAVVFAVYMLSHINVDIMGYILGAVGIVCLGAILGLKIWEDFLK